VAREGLQQPLESQSFRRGGHPQNAREGNSPTLEMAYSDSTDTDHNRNEAGRFLTGNNRGPGRPKGSRNKLSEAVLQALADDFEANGKEVIERVRAERPHDYLKVCASVMPKRLENEDVTPLKDPREMTDAELEAVVWKQYEALGITDKDVDDAAARLESQGRDPTRTFRRGSIRTSGPKE
jgi:hypothetical protein